MKIGTKVVLALVVVGGVVVGWRLLAKPPEGGKPAGTLWKANPPPLITSVEVTYVVKRGDTLGNIAIGAGVPLAHVLRLNPQIIDANKIKPGQVIRLA